MHSIVYFTTAVAYGYYIGNSFFHSFDFTVVIGIANVDREDYTSVCMRARELTTAVLIDYPLKRAW